MGYDNTVCTYIAMYKGKKIEVKDTTIYGAQLKAAAIFKAKKSYDVIIKLVAVGDREIVHVAVD